MTERASMELSADEVRAWARVAAVAELARIPTHLEDEFGDEFRVAYDSVLLKLSKAETALGQIEPLTVDEAETIAAFTSDLDQRRAALAERRRRETERPREEHHEDD